MIRNISIAVALAALACTTAARAQNLIVDGSFEKPALEPGGFTIFRTGEKFSHWEVVGNPGNVALFNEQFSEYGVRFPAYSGHQFIDLTGIKSQSATGVRQSVRTTPGASYDLTFYVGNIHDPIRPSDLGKTTTVNVFVDGLHVMTATNTRGEGKLEQVWQKFSTTIVATRTRTTFTFINGDPKFDNQCSLDWISVVPVPPTPSPGE